MAASAAERPAYHFPLHDKKKKAGLRYPAFKRRDNISEGRLVLAPA